MPTVPKVADPFGNTVQGKDQSRLPQGNVRPIFKPSETDIAIAMATMHQQGRLFTPKLDSLPDAKPATPDSKLADVAFNSTPMAQQ